MVQGYERREVTDDPNAGSRALDPQSIPVPGVSRPAASSFDRVGEAERQLSEVLGGVSVGLDKYISKKNKQWEVEGMMKRAEGRTEAEVAKDGNRFTTRGWQAMNGRLATDELHQAQLDFISNEGKQLDSASYQKHLSDSFREADEKVPASDPETKELIRSYALESFPKLVQQQIIANNTYNKEQTIDVKRKDIMSGAAANDIERVRELTDPKNNMGLSQEEHWQVVGSAYQDAIESKNPAAIENIKASIIANGGDPEAIKPKPVETVKDVGGLLNLIGQAESTNNYNAILGGVEPNLTRMTLSQVEDLQKKMVGSGKESGAVGKYQFIRNTLNSIKSDLGLTGNEVFNEELQDKLAVYLLKRDGKIDDFRAGKISIDEFQTNVSKIWAGIPKDKSGKSSYEGVGSNKATVQPGAFAQALVSDGNNSTFYEVLRKSGMRSDDVSKVIKASERYETEKSQQFDANRLLTEKNIEAQAIDLNDKDLIAKIDEAKNQGGYSDAWANGVWNSSLSQRKTDKVERDKVQKVQSLIQQNAVQAGSKEEQEKAIDIVTAAAVKSNPAALDPTAANRSDAQKAAMDQVYKFMHSNQITDARLRAQWEAATIGDIVDANGKVKANALDAYSGYMQAVSSSANPIWAQSLLSEKTKDLFLMADSYRSGDNGADAEQALAAASTFIQQQNEAKGVNNLPWWKDQASDAEITEKIYDTTVPGIMSAFGWSRDQAQMRWDINGSSVEMAAKDPSVISRVKMEASQMWRSYSNWTDQKAAQELVVAKASQKVISGSEYIAGTFVYTGDQPNISTKIGMGGVKNAANMVTSRIMAELGPTIWGDNYNSTDIYTMPQKWYEEAPGIGKAWEATKHYVTSPGEAISGLVDKTQEKLLGVPDFAVMVNKTGNALVLSPYTNYNRTQQGPAFILPVEKMKEAASFLNKGDEAGFKKWAEAQKASLPKY